MDREKEKLGHKGFKVQFKENPMMIPKEGAVLVFDRVVCNVDDCYNSNTGVFTAQKTGVYSFYVSGIIATDDNNGFTDLALQKTTGQPLQKVYLKGRNDIFVGSQGSAHVRVKLERGEQVQLRHLKGDLGLKGQSHTTFSGVLEFNYPDSTSLGKKKF